MENRKPPYSEVRLTPEELSTRVIRHIINRHINHVELGEQDKDQVVESTYHRTLWATFPPSKLDIYNEAFANSTNQAVVAGRITSSDIQFRTNSELVEGLVGEGGEALTTGNSKRIIKESRDKVNAAGLAKVLTFGGFMTLDQLIALQLAYVSSAQNIAEVNLPASSGDYINAWDMLNTLQKAKVEHNALRSILDGIKISAVQFPEFAQALCELSKGDMKLLPILNKCSLLAEMFSGQENKSGASIFDSNAYKDTLLYTLPHEVRSRLVANGIGYERLQSIDFNGINAIGRLPLTARVDWHVEVHKLMKNMGLEHARLALYLNQHFIHEGN